MAIRAPDGANNTKNNDIIHLFPQLWWERLKRHRGWLKGQENRNRSSYSGLYPLQCPKTDTQAFASGPQSAGLEVLMQGCVNLSFTQKELKCERGRDRAGHVAVENRAFSCK